MGGPKVDIPNTRDVISGAGEQFTLIEGTMNGKPVKLLFNIEGTRYQELKNHYEFYKQDEETFVAVAGAWKEFKVTKKNAEKSLQDKAIEVLHSKHSKLIEILSSLANRFLSIPKSIYNHPKLALCTLGSVISFFSAYYFSSTEEIIDQPILCPKAAALGIMNPELKTSDTGILAFKNLGRFYKCN